MSAPTSSAQAGDIVKAYNGGGSVIAANRSVMLDSTGARYVKYPTATTDPLYGVTREAIAVGEWGDVQIRGKALVAAHGALATIGTKLMTTASTGRAAAFSAGSGVNAAPIGCQLTTAAAQDDLLEVELCGPFIIEQGA